MADCGFLDAPCRARELGLEVAGDMLDFVIDDIINSVEGAVQTLTTFWVYIPSNVTMATSGVAPFLESYLAPFTAIFLAATLMVGAIKLMVARDGQVGRELASGLVKFAIVSFAGIGLITIGGAAADDFSVGIIDYSLDSGDFGSNLLAMLTLTSGGNPAFGLLNSFLIGFIGVPAAWLQAGLMIIRSAMLPILAGCMTMSAAFFTTEIGRSWFNKFLIWTIGFLAYKPAASIIYAAGFTMAGNYSIIDARTMEATAYTTLNMIMGLMLILMAILILPAMMRFVIPVSGALAGKGGTGMMFAGASLGIIASGAISNGSPAPAVPMGSPAVHRTDSGARGQDGATGNPGASLGGIAGAAGAAGAGGPAAAAVQGSTRIIQETRGTAEGAIGEGEQ